GKKFSDLDAALQNEILSYQIDFNEALNPSDEEVREVYARVNKYTVPLNKQELRRADFPGDFLKTAEKLAVHPYFDRIGIFTPGNRRRYSDVEYISELLAGMIGGIQDKKSTLDEFYTRYSDWDDQENRAVLDRFKSAIEDVKAIFQDVIEISRSRFKHK